MQLAELVRHHRPIGDLDSIFLSVSEIHVPPGVRGYSCHIRRLSNNQLPLSEVGPAPCRSDCWSGSPCWVRRNETRLAISLIDASSTEACRLNFSQKVI
jgi:hypothetical protein